MRRYDSGKICVQNYQPGDLIAWADVPQGSFVISVQRRPRNRTKITWMTLWFRAPSYGSSNHEGKIYTVEYDAYETLHEGTLIRV